MTKTLWPGQPGTLKLLRRFGDALLCVRYRTDARGRTRYTTVELVIEQAPIQKRPGDRTLVEARLDWHDAELRAQAMRLGAKWNPQTRRWIMSLRTARALGLSSRHRKTSP